MNRQNTQLYKELLSIAYRQLKFSSITLFINGVVLALIVAPYAKGVLVWGWLSLVAVICLYRFWTAIKYEKDPEKYSPKRWERMFLEGLIVSTLAWSAAPFLFFIPDNYMVQATFLIIYAGLSAGAIGTLASLNKAFKIFLYPLLVPIVIVLLLQNSYFHYLMALLVSLYIVMMDTIANRFYKNHIKILQTQQMYIEEKEKTNASNEQFRFIFENAPMGIFFYDSDLVLREMNQKLGEIMGVDKETLVGLDLLHLPDQRLTPTLKAPIEGKDGIYKGEYIAKYTKLHLYIHLLTSPLRHSNGEIMGAIGIIQDVTKETLAHKKMEHQAMYDTLTNIPNRLTLIKAIEREWLKYQKQRTECALLFIDLDYFKHINDSLGHSIGDRVLIETAKRLQECVREEGMVARIGGDEFVVLLPDLPPEPKSAATQAEEVAIGINKALKKPIFVDAYQLIISLSVGIALLGKEETSAEDLFKHADLAMYQAKKEGRSNIRFYQEQMDAWIRRRLALENGLRNALNRKELEVYYQPIVSFESDKIIGAEALLRWHSQTFGEVAPSEFIPVAEASGLIVEIGEFVLRTACEQFVTWQKQSNSMRKIAINISVRQFNAHDFVERLPTIIDSSGILADCIELELVESIVIDDVAAAKQKMQQLRALGFGLAIDDFGTGYSSLSYLKKLPFTSLKIDQSFVKDMSMDEDDRELVETIISIAKRFDLDVVAEGVEEQEQYHLLKSKGCDAFQGFLFSSAVDKEAFGRLLD